MPPSPEHDPRRPTSYRLTRPRRLLNALVTRMLRVGLGPAHTYLLSVPGRRTGRLYSTPVSLVENTERWLVAPYGEVAWVRNARAAGQVALRRGRRSESVEVIAVGPDVAAPVLREYVRNVRIARPFFDAGPDSPLDAFAAEAHRHPVFRLRTT